MKTVIILVLTAFLSVPASAQEVSAVMIVQNDENFAADVTKGQTRSFAPRDAAGVDLKDFLWTARPVIVFADSPNDPQFREQMAMLEQGWPDLRARDVVVIQDTNPDRATMSDVRRKLRPRGFSLIWIDKDGNVRLRKPVVWSARELTHAIDKSPIRRQEMLDERTGR